MKKIYHYLLKHLKEDFNLTSYTLIAIFLAISIWLNYKLDFEDSVIDSYRGKPVYLLYFFLFYSFAYYSAVILYLVGKGQLKLLGKTSFWIKSGLGLFFLSLDVSFYWHEGLLRLYMPIEVQYYASKVFINLVNIATILLPLYLIYRYYDRKDKNFYGFGVKDFDFRPYVYMLLIMVPIITAASFLPGFQKDYPMYKDAGAAAFLQWPDYITALIYEVAYGWNFVSIELIFRGFFVLGMAKFLGRGSVIAMISVYCFLHFGKPMGESISSIFGGYILGVIALESKSIWGGIMIHMGIAWLMELAAWLQKINPS